MNRFVSYKMTQPPKGLVFNNDDYVQIEEVPVLTDLSDYIYPEVIEEQYIPNEVQPTTSYNTNILFNELLDKIGANAKITSGYRPGAKTKQGKRSWHSIEGGAYDIVPNDGNFDRLRQILTTHPLSVAWFRDHDKGILDETTKEMLAKTGGTGAHFHIGPDSKAERFWKTVQKAKSGIKIKKENRGKFTSYCGGKVTNECIQRGKNSSSATIRKRATFAANARKWHKK